jgi:hypothetical protein
MYKGKIIFLFQHIQSNYKEWRLLLESKKEIYDLIPKEFYPATMLFKKGASVEEVMDTVAKANFKFPIIAKPDVGMRGLQVKKITSFEELKDYTVKSKVDFLVQEYVAYENEVGIFYYRYPGENNGHISGIVSKELLSVTGNGILTVEELLQKDKRYILQLPVLRKTYKDQMQRVLDEGENFLMVPYGNHARGAKFIDISNNIDERLINTIDQICLKISGFYFGRLDIRYNSWSELKGEKNFLLSNLMAPAANQRIYMNPGHSLFFAWKEIIRHWIILLKISMHNHTLTGLPYMTTSSGLKMLKDNKAYVKILTEEIH